MNKFTHSMTLLALLVFAGLCIGLSGCASKLNPNDKSFSIDIPPGWQQTGNLGPLSFMAMSPMEGNQDRFQENLNVVVEILPIKLSLDTYVAASKANLRKIASDLSIHDEGSISLNGHNATWIVYSFSMMDMELKNLVYLTVKGKKAYVITFSAARSSFSEFRPVFEKAAQSFKIL